jgi:hypothetical protein
MTRLRLAPFVFFVVLAVVVPLVGRWARRAGPPRCAFDGLPIEPLYEVRVTGPAGEVLRFCCVRCARSWLDRGDEAARTVHVTDEASGALVSSETAYFVESRVVTNPVTENRVHAFREQADAEEHVRAFAGRMLRGAERPF